MNKNRIWRIGFSVYCCVMLYLLFHRTGYTPGIPYVQQLRINLVPFHTVGLYLRLLSRGTLRRIAIVNLAGNVVMFVPLGFFLPRIFPKLRKFWKVLPATAAIIILVELTQYFSLLGSCDIDDLILNILGAAMGYGLYKLFNKRACP